ncbi:MAG: DUF3108 domain-containing protein, partial [Myxococcota bacterium]
MTPLPPLLAPAASSAAPVHRLLFHPGENMIFDVRWRGMSAGQVQLAVDSFPPPGAKTVTVHSEFKTAGVAATIVRIRHQLRSLIDLGQHRPLDSSELLVEGRDSHQIEVIFERWRYRLGRGAPVQALPERHLAHSAHSALGALRAWAGSGATAGHLYVLLGRHLHRVAVAEP